MSYKLSSLVTDASSITTEMLRLAPHEFIRLICLIRSPAKGGIRMNPLTLAGRWSSPRQRRGSL